MTSEEQDQDDQVTTVDGDPPPPRPRPLPTSDPTHIIDRAIEEEMHTSYIDYAMSVIVGRALPDVRDGLKPVHRRVLYAMGELGMTHNRPFKKSARIVGEVLGKYHPHGDQSIYDTLVRMAQPFSLRYPLVDGQGNFGSVDGDRAASMRYTEARLHRMAEELLQDLDKETVLMVDNFDGSLQEPKVTPCKFPNLLINGSTGIAVGMATNMAPHNLNEAIDACIRVIDEPDVEVEDLIEIIPAPDFPTGGEIYGLAGVHQAYRTGRGRCKIRARYRIEEMDKGKQALIIYEIPYQVNKSKLLEDIAKLVRDRRVDGITDLRDESDRTGMRIVIELRRDAIPEVIMNHLFKHTQMQVTFGIINIALVEGEPRELGLKAIIRYFLDHRFEIVTKRSEFELRKAKARAHILEGLIIALDNLDEVITLIRANQSVAEANQALQEHFLLSELQAKAILEMRLSKLTGLERQAIKEEFQELTVTIERLTAILADPGRIYTIIREELQGIKERYGDARRTGYVEAVADIEIEDLIPREDVLVTISNIGYIKRLGIDTYRTQRRGGVGLIGMETKEKDFVVDMFRSHSHHYILFITNRGQLFWLKTYMIPVGGRHAKGKPIVNLLPRLEEGEEVQSAIPVDEFDETRNLLFATRNGVIKKTPLYDYRHVRISGVRAIRLDEGDELITTKLSSGDDQVILASANGKAARFDESDVRTTGRVTRGVRGLRLKEGDQLVDMALVAHRTCERCRRPILKDDIAKCPECDHVLGEVPEVEEPPGIPEFLTITENGFGKRSPVEDYRHIKRGGVGVITIKTNERNGRVVAVRVVSDVDHLICTSKSGMIIRMAIINIRSQSRNTQGVRIMQLKKRRDRLQAVTVLRGAALELDEDAEGGDAQEEAPEEVQEELEK